MKGTDMFNRKTSQNTEGVSKAIDELLEEMSHINKDSETYAAMVTQLTKLYELKEIDCKVDSGRYVDVNTLVLAAANVAGIVMIVSHERANVVTSKAVNLLMKLR